MVHLPFWLSIVAIDAISSVFPLPVVPTTRAGLVRDKS
jgi:hypothetical protein